MSERATRRGFLAALGTAGAGAALAPGAEAATRTQGSVPFHGPHQAGIATPTPSFVQFATLDVVSSAVSDLKGILAELSSAAARLTAGRPVGALQTGPTPPVDTGEAVGLGAARLTITFGLGPRLFQRERFGLSKRRPAPLVALPAFAGDALEAGISGGDIGIQACSEDPQVAFHAIHDLIRLAAPAARPRWSLAGFGRTLNARRTATPRNLMGFKDGTANIMSGDHAALRRFVWAGRPESPRWMHGGSYLVLRRIQMVLSNWDATPLDQQERTFGRHKASGAPLGAGTEFAPLDLSAVAADGTPVIPSDAHARLASPAYNHSQRILRRGYSYLDGIDRAGATVAGGQLFICFQRDPRTQFIPIQRRLAAGDALGQHIQHIGSAIFACPPGARPGGYVGEGLFS